MSKIIAVIGATGNQGGSVANTFLEDPEWRVRAITRNPASPKAQALASRGAEVVAADMDDKASLARAFAGVHAVYLVSDPISILSAGPDKAAVKPAEGQNLFDWATACEVAQLKNAVDAAAGTASLERLVLSVLPDVKGLSGGKYAHVYHFDSKAKGEAYVRETYPELWAKTSSYVAGNFLSNYLPGGMNPATKAEDGTLQFHPGIKADTQIPFFAAEEDSGPIVQALVREPTAGKKVLGQRESMTINEYLAIVEKTKGRKAQYVAPPADYTQLPSPPFLQQSIFEMGKWWDEFGYDGREAHIVTPKELTHPPALGTVEEYLKKHNWD